MALGLTAQSVDRPDQSGRHHGTHAPATAKNTPAPRAAASFFPSSARARASKAPQPPTDTTPAPAAPSTDRSNPFDAIDASNIIRLLEIEIVAACTSRPFLIERDGRVERGLAAFMPRAAMPRPRQEQRPRSTASTRTHIRPPIRRRWGCERRAAEGRDFLGKGLSSPARWPARVGPPAPTQSSLRNRWARSGHGHGHSVFWGV